ncbi:MAG: DMT family transporter [Thermoanaerobaculia bacterium]
MREALGLVIVGGIGFAAPRLGLSRTLVITVAAQLCAAVLIDQWDRSHRLRHSAASCSRRGPAPFPWPGFRSHRS